MRRRDIVAGSVRRAARFAKQTSPQQKPQPLYFKQRLAAGQCLIGAGIYSHSPDIVEYATSEMDWIWWEGQHSHADWQTTIHGLRTAYSMGIPVLVRTWTRDGGTIERLLDTGAEGIIVPMVDTAEMAREIVSHCYYPPMGNRSFGAVRMERIEPDLKEWNQRIVTIMQIESPRAVKNAAAIARVPGVDGLLLGGRDLAVRRGKVATDYTVDDVVKEDRKYFLEVCRKNHKVAAAIAPTPEALVARIREGYGLICAGFDVELLLMDYRRMRQAADIAFQSLGNPPRKR
jgi:2-keto-3-deoxy-L-rhamnonate aldolase RhmA